jgi:hypothetical protein
MALSSAIVTPSTRRCWRRLVAVVVVVVVRLLFGGGGGSDGDLTAIPILFDAVPSTRKSFFIVVGSLTRSLSQCRLDNGFVPQQSCSSRRIRGIIHRGLGANVSHQCSLCAVQLRRALDP